MWAFLGKKEGRRDQEGRRDPLIPEKRLSLTDEESQLQLSRGRVKTLKKILHHQAHAFTTQRDFDIFVVSWDVDNLPEPPDDISPLLPPDVWPEPDMIAIGLQRCPISAAPLWSSVVAKSIYKYSPVFKPISTDAPFDEQSGNLILLFLRQELLQFVSGYSSRLTSVNSSDATALRFGFHQSTLAFLCAKLNHNVPFSLFDPCGEDVEEIETNMINEAKNRQRFASLLSSVTFDVQGKKFPLSQHAVIVWMGLKDVAQRGAREEKMMKSILLERELNGGNLPASLDSSNPFATLDSHGLDVRFTTRLLLAPPCTHPFGTFLTLPSRSCRGGVEILKAGVMRLVLELLDDKGISTPSEAAPELVLFRVSIPSVDPIALRELFFRMWRILRMSKESEIPAVSLEPQLLRITTPLSPFVPHTLKFKIVNRSPSKLPAAFHILCISDSGRSVVPLAKHSFLHQAFTVPKRHREEEQIRPAQPKDNLDLQKRVNQLRKIAAKNWPLGGKKSQKPSPRLDASTVADTPTFQKQESIGEAPATTRGTLTSRLSRGGGNEEFSLTKWMLVEPIEGVVLGGKEAEIRVTILIQEGFEQTMGDIDPVTLVVRMDECKSDLFLHIEPTSIAASLEGLGPNQLMDLGNVPIATMSELNTSPLPHRKRFSSPLKAGGGISACLPMPKELWCLLSYIHQKLLWDLDRSHEHLPEAWLNQECPASEWFCLPLMLQRAARNWDSAAPSIRQDMIVIKKCLETHTQIPPSCSVEAALRTMEKWARALPIPLVPREYVTEIADGMSADEQKLHFVCRAMLLSLPMVARNILMSLSAVLRELVRFHALTSKYMLPVLVTSLIRDPTLASPAIEEVVSPEDRKKIATQLISVKSNELPETPNSVLIDALTEWAARFVARDTPPNLSLPFVRHFLDGF